MHIHTRVRYEDTITGNKPVSNSEFSSSVSGASIVDTGNPIMGGGFGLINDDRIYQNLAA